MRGMLDEDNKTFVRGKHSGLKLAQVAEDEPSYLRYLVNNVSLPKDERQKIIQSTPPALDGRTSYLPSGYYEKTS